MTSLDLALVSTYFNLLDISHCMWRELTKTILVDAVYDRSCKQCVQANRPCAFVIVDISSSLSSILLTSLNCYQNKVIFKQCMMDVLLLDRVRLFVHIIWKLEHASLVRPASLTTHHLEKLWRLQNLKEHQPMEGSRILIECSSLEQSIEIFSHETQLCIWWFL